MSKTRFDKAFAQFIRDGDERVTPSTFYEVLAEIERDRAKKTVELKAKLVEGKLQFEPCADVRVHENAILWGDHRIVVTVS